MHVYISILVSISSKTKEISYTLDFVSNTATFLSNKNPSMQNSLQYNINLKWSRLTVYLSILY